MRRQGRVPRDERPRIFQRFWRRKGGASPGAGLGLVIVKEIADAPYGTICVDDNAARNGAVFPLRLTPCSEKPRPAAPMPSVHEFHGPFERFPSVVATSHGVDWVNPDEHAADGEEAGPHLLFRPSE